MKLRAAMAVGVGALVLAAPAHALAQDQPAPASEPPAAEEPGKPEERRAPGDPKPAKIELRIKGVKNGKVDVGKRVTVIGKIRPFVKGQRVRIWLQQARKTVIARKTFVEQVKNRNVGTFRLRTKRIIEQGHYRAYARKPATPNQLQGRARTPEFNVRYPDLDPGDRSNAVKLFNKLLAKQAYYTSSGRKYGGATARAVLAFRKVNNMPRTMNATPGIFRMLANGKGGFKLKYPGAGKHIEADLSRQVMVLSRKGKAQHIFHVSTGKPSTPTVTGRYETYRKDRGINALGMIDSVYFHRGYATHGYKSVPTYPASNGCLRTPPPNARFIYNWIDYGDYFYIYP